MTCSAYVRRWPASVLMVMAFVAAPALAAAQGGVGSGPITGQLAVSEPQTGAISFGSLKVAPGLTVREIGVDDNVFDEADNPKSDWVAAGTPDVSAFWLLRWVKFSAYGGAEMQYYNKYTSERSITPLARARIDFLLSRIKPFIGAGETQTRARPNGEIDVRANQVDDEVSGGIAYSLSVHADAFGSVIKTRVRFQDAEQSGVPLDQSLNRDATNYMGGVRTDLTPLMSLEVRGEYKEDRFQSDPTRNGDSRTATAVFTIAPAAVITGGASIAYQDYLPVDPLVTRFKGVTGSGFITYPFLELGRLNVGYIRGIDYSFDVAEAYFLQNAVNLACTTRLFGDVDFQGRGSISYYDYGYRDGSVPRRDTMHVVGGSLGYNLRNKTRIGLNYEYSERRSPELASRNYIRRRTYLNWALAF